MRKRVNLAMYWRRITFLLFAALCCSPRLLSQAEPSQTSPARPSIDQYIAAGWDSLTRSMSECKSVVDTKVTTTPVLYLPAGIAVPPAVSAMQNQCKVEVAHLPRSIHHLGDVSGAEIPKPGLLYLPNPYVVPGGRFNEMYGWDSYFILLGLLEDGRVPLAKGIVENFFFEIENYGAILNANRTYFFTRSQPPLLSSMIAEIYNKTHDKEWLSSAYGYAERDYSLWTSPVHRAGNTGLARYADLGSGPVPEMADDSTYYPDVIRWLLAHPKMGSKYLMKASEPPTHQQATRLQRTSCDIGASKVCAEAHAGGYRLSAAFYRGDRAMRESGFDTTFRFGPFSGSTNEYAPVCLNSLLYKYARDMASFASLLGKKSDVQSWTRRAEARKAAIVRYLWHQDTTSFYDYNFVSRRPSTYNYISEFYPLWAGLASKEQAKDIEKHVTLFEHEGGLAMSDYASGTQWDMPFGWAPTNWFAIQGLALYGFTDEAARLAASFRHTVESNYTLDGTIREKYNVVSGSANVQVAAGYKANVVGFGWTNGVYLRMASLLTAASATPTTPQAAAPGR